MTSLNKVITDSRQFLFDFRPDRFWFFNLKYKRSYFNDDNRQNQVFGTAEYRSLLSHLLSFITITIIQLGEPELSHGYLIPVPISSHALGLYTGLDITKKLFIEAKASGV